VPRLMRWRLVFQLLALLALAACGRHIGDDCETNVQCSAQGDRQCDVSQPSGYCTVEGCDVSSCPDDALCVRFFPAQALELSEPCDPRNSSGCGVREICLAEGFCVEPRFERRFCMKSCSSKGDCRDGYNCCPTNVGGVELLPRGNQPAGVARFCTAQCAQPPMPGDAGPDAMPMPDAAPPDAALDAPVDAPPAQDAGEP